MLKENRFTSFEFNSSIYIFFVTFLIYLSYPIEIFLISHILKIQSSILPHHLYSWFSSRKMAPFLKIKMNKENIPNNDYLKENRVILTRNKMILGNYKHKYNTTSKNVKFLSFLVKFAKLISGWKRSKK